MKNNRLTIAKLILPTALFSLTSLLFPAGAVADYIQQNLVSNQPGLAQNTDLNLKNPWGISYSPTGPFWVSNNQTATSTLYNGAGTPQALVVTIPTHDFQPTGGTPTGQVFNANFGLGAFFGDRFIFATEDGTISGWQGGTSSVIRSNQFANDAVYKGLAIDSTANHLFAANFAGTGKIDTFNSSYTTPSPGIAGSFIDPALPSGYAPFNVQNINGVLYVAYAYKANPTDTDETAGDGKGIVSLFDLQGNYLKRLISDGGKLNAPWGFAVAPSDFGEYSGNLLVGNFGDGTINAFNPSTGDFIGTLSDVSGNPIVIDGLWGIAFGNGGNGGATNRLYFAAGINDEADGLFGSLAVLPEPGSFVLLATGLLGMMARRRKQTPKRRI